MAASAFASPSPRSRCPCQSTSTGSPDGFTIRSMTKRTTARAESGVACPTVSAMHSRFAPHSMAFP